MDAYYAGQATAHVRSHPHDQQAQALAADWAEAMRRTKAQQQTAALVQPTAQSAAGPAAIGAGAGLFPNPGHAQSQPVPSFLPTQMPTPPATDAQSWFQHDTRHA